MASATRAGRAGREVRRSPGMGREMIRRGRGAGNGFPWVVACLVLAAASASAQTDLDVNRERSLSASISVFQTFDDNLFETKTDREYDFVTNVQPQYDLFYPFRFAAVGLKAAIPIYFHWNRRDRTDVLYDLIGTISSARFHGFGVTVSDEFTPVQYQFGNSEIDVFNADISDKNKIQQNDFKVSPSFQFNAGARSSFVIRYLFDMVHYADAAFRRDNDYYQHAASMTSTFYLTARLSLAIQYAFMARDLMKRDLLRYSHEGRVGIEATWTRLTFGVFGGVTYLQYAGDLAARSGYEDDLGEYVEASLSWVATEWLSLNLAYRRILAADVYSNTYFVQDGALSFSLPMTNWLTMNLKGYVRDFRDETVFQKSDLVFGAQADFTFVLVERLNLIAGYAYTQNLGTAAGNDFNNHFATVGLNYTF
jgi:hypothetical protein